MKLILGGVHFVFFTKTNSVSDSYLESFLRIFMPKMGIAGAYLIGWGSTYASDMDLE